MNKTKNYPQKKFRMLFIGFMILGKTTAFKNLQGVVDSMEDVESTWLPIELEPTEWTARIPFMWRSHSLRIGEAARSRVRALERSGKRFDAAFFNHILPAVLLRGFRRRVPSVDSLDVTPLDLIRHGQAYYDVPRKLGPRFLQRFKVSMTKSIYKQAAYIFPYSEFARRSLVEDYGIRMEKTIVLPPGTDLRLWNRRKPVRRKKAGLRVLFVGSDFERKGGGLLLDIAGRKEFRSWKFHVVTKSDVSVRPPNVVIHKNVTARSQELYDLYDGADVFALPTQADFSPTNSICEAMAMGLPVISTNVGGLDEIVLHEKNGFIVPRNDAEALARCLKRLDSDEKLRLRLGKNARAMAEERFDVEKNAKRIVDYMKEAVRTRKS